MATLLPEGKQSFTTATGIPLVGGKLYTYDAGTNTPRPTYSDAAGAVPNTNPVVMDARGEATVFWEGSYKVVLKDALDVTIWTVDNVVSADTYAAQIDTLLRADLASTADVAKGDVLVGVMQPVTGAVAQNQHEQNQAVYTAATFGALGNGSDDTAAMNLAIANVPANGTLLLRGKLGNAIRTTGLTVTRSDITIKGDRKPRASSDRKALTGGTIIYGPVVIEGDNLHLEGFGVDAGITWSNTYNGGTGTNGLVVHDLDLSQVRRGITIRDVISMARVGGQSDPQAAFHAMLLEGLENCYFNDLTGVGGWYGVVVKAANTQADGLTGLDNDVAAVYFKSNTYGPVSNVAATNIVGIAGTARMFVGLLVQASDAQLDTVTISGVTTNGGVTSTRIEAEGAQPAVNVTITGVSARNATGGVSFRGPVYASRIEGVVDQPTSGTGLEVAPFPVGSVEPIDVSVNLRINAAGSHSADNLVSITAANTKVDLERAICTLDYVTPGKLLITKNTVIGDVTGVLSSDRTEANLLNGWTAFTGGQKCGTQTRNGITYGYGRVKFTGSTSDTFLQLGAGAFPDAVPQTLSVMGFDGGTSKPVPVTLALDASGNLSIFPNRAAYTISYIDLSTLRIAAQLPATSGI